MPIQKRQPLKPILRARRRRLILPAYFDLGGKGLFILVILGAALLALLALAQTGQAVSVGYDLRKLQQDERALRWDRETLLENLAATVNPADLHRWAQDHDWKWLTPQDITYIPLPEDAAAAAEEVPALADEP